MLHAVAERLASPLRLPAGRGRIPALEGMRGLAVLLVFFVHYAAFLEPWISGSAIWAAVWRSLFNGGRLGVELFFTISGFLIYGMLMRARLTPLEFLRRRVWRIYPVFLAVFVLYLVLSLLSPDDNRIPASPLDGAVYIIQNLLLLPGLFPLKPVITVSWTLSYEVAFYALAPLLVMGLRLRERPRAQRIAVWMVIALALLAAGPHARAVLFVAGILAWEAIDAAQGWPVGKRADVPALLAFLTMIALTVAFDAMDSTTGTLEPHIWAPAVASAGCASLAFAGMAGDGPVSALLSSSPLRWLGNLSYSFYLIHSTALRCFAEVLKRVVPAADGPAPWLLPALLPLAFALAALAALFLFELVERPFSLTPRRSQPVPRAVTAPAE